MKFSKGSKEASFFGKFQTYVCILVHFFLAFALRNILVQELVLTRLLEMSKPDLTCFVKNSTRILFL